MTTSSYKGFKENERLGYMKDPSFARIKFFLKSKQVFLERKVGDSEFILMKERYISAIDLFPVKEYNGACKLINYNCHTSTATVCHLGTYKFNIKHKKEIIINASGKHLLERNKQIYSVNECIIEHYMQAGRKTSCYTSST